MSPSPKAADTGQDLVVDRRTRNRERRRSAVYRAAVELFIEQGYENTTMEQVAQRADVARATVFNHFPRKTAFIDEWTMLRRHRAADAVAREDIKGWPLDRILRRYVSEMARLSEDTREETVAMMTAAVHVTDLLGHPALADELSSYVRKAQKEGAVPKKLNPAQAGLLTSTAYFAVLTQWISEEPAPFPLEQELLSMLDIVLFGVLASDDAIRLPARTAAPRPSRARKASAS